MKSILRFCPAVTFLWLCSLAPAGAQSASRASLPVTDLSKVPILADPSETTETITIPGPLRPFLRMAAVSQQAPLNDVLPLLAHHIAVYGYEGSKFQTGQKTEYLTLLQRYIARARAMETLAGKEQVIRLMDCKDSGQLLEIIGYRLQSECGPNTALETADPERAFITLDSGFPLVDLEDSLRTGKPFEYPFPSTQVPVLFSAKDWSEKGRDVLDSLVDSPVTARLYWALSRMDTETRNDMRQSLGVRRLAEFAPVLEYYGATLKIRSGRVVVPGGTTAEAGWAALVGANPGSPAQFLEQLLKKDSGWLAAYYDAIARTDHDHQTYFANPARIQRFYRGIRNGGNSPGAAQPVFRPDSNIVIMMARLPLDASGQPRIPGNLEAWKDIFQRKSNAKMLRGLASESRGWQSADDLIEGLFAASKINTFDGPIQSFLVLSEVNRHRAADQQLSAETVRLMANHFSRLRAQYSIFAEFPGLNNAAITRFIAATEGIDGIQDPTVRSDALGIFQANVALWQIFARQGELRDADLSTSWNRVLEPFTKIGTSAQLFDAGRASLVELMRATSPNAGVTQEKILDLLAGPISASDAGQRVHQDLLVNMRSAMQDQRLASLDTVLGLASDLELYAKAAKPTVTESLQQESDDLHSIEMPRSIFTSGERTQWANGYVESRHIAMQRQTDIAKFLKGPHAADDVKNLRGQLTPYLRDTVVGFVYAYYEPPGAQLLHNNPLLVRSHEFAYHTGIGPDEPWLSPELQGTGNTAGNGAYIVGSLEGLPYALAQVEQGFIVPGNVQALTWQEVTPELLLSANLPRWWGVTPNELHAVALTQAAGEELLESAQKDPTLRQQVMQILEDQMPPQRLKRLDAVLDSQNMHDFLPAILPSEKFYLATQYGKQFAGEIAKFGANGKALDDLTNRFPAETSTEKISEDFGIPHPILGQNYGAELLQLQLFPSFMNYPGRLLAETWESTNLYWARIADELNYPPVMLNEFVPQLTRRMVENIFATNFEDWAALQRAMEITGAEFRRGQIAALAKPTAGSQQ